MSKNASNMHKGKVISVDGNNLSSLCNDGKTHHHTATKDTKVSCDGKTCELKDLKEGTSVTVIMNKDDDQAVRTIRCRSKTNSSETTSIEI